MDVFVRKEAAIRSLVKAAVGPYASGFETRHLKEVDDPSGTINMKVHNVFIAALGSDIQYYTALVRSLDSSLGNMLEGLAIAIAELSFVVSHHVEGQLSSAQTSEIARLLETYRRRLKVPEVADYIDLIGFRDGSESVVRHESDYYLHDAEADRHYLIELKIGGDLDNKKAPRSRTLANRCSQEGHSSRTRLGSGSWTPPTWRWRQRRSSRRWRGGSNARAADHDRQTRGRITRASSGRRASRRLPNRGRLT